MRVIACLLRVAVDILRLVGIPTYIFNYRLNNVHIRACTRALPSIPEKIIVAYIRPVLVYFGLVQSTIVINKTLLPEN